MKAIRMLLMGAAAALAVGATAQTERQPWEKNGFGVSVSEDISTEDAESDRITYARGYQVKDGVRAGFNAPGVSAYYLWHPFLKADVRGPADGFFLKPEVGFQLEIQDKQPEWESFVFNVNLLAGYTFRVHSVGIDIFTGPVSKIGSKRYDRTPDEAFWGLGEDEKYGDTRNLEKKFYSAGVSWRFGVGVNYRHLGLSVSYNQPMGRYQRIKVYDTSIPGTPLVGRESNRQLRYVTLALSYKF